MSVTKSADVSHCNGCELPDTDEMVQCDQCDGWWHYYCARVGASIGDSNRSWRCINCSISHDSRSATSVRSSSSSARLRLKQLEEAKALEDQKHQKDLEYLAEKHRLEAEAETEKSERGSSMKSFGSHCSHCSTRSQVKNWVAKQNPSVGDGAIEQLRPAEGNTSTPKHFPDVHGATYPTSQWREDSTVQLPQHLLPQTPFGSLREQLPPTKYSGIMELPPIGNPEAKQGKKMLVPCHEPPVLRQPTVQQQTQTMTKEPQYPYLHQNPLNPVNPQVYADNMIPASRANVQVQVQPATQANQQMTVQSQRPVPVHQQHTSSDLEKAYFLPQHLVPEAQAKQQVAVQSEAFVSNPVEQTNQQMITHTELPMLNSVQQQNYFHPQQYSGASGNQQKAVNSQAPIPKQQQHAGLNPRLTSLHSQQRPYFSSPTMPQSQQNCPAYSWPQPPAPVYWQPPYAMQWPPVPEQGIISAQQLAARHVVSKELPKFDGDPLEWPMFLSAFESTTSICGLQPDENLARLQKSLMGSAREKVKSILTLPNAIPDIINTLRDECGRPDQLVHCLLSKIRYAQAPNVNRLETLVTFGREVRNLVTYIEAAGLQAHLSNPMLLTELVGKLPPTLRLDWGLHTQRIPEVSLKAFSEYVTTIKTAACHVSLPSEINQSHDGSNRGKKQEKSSFMNAHSELECPEEASPRKPSRDPKPCFVCQRNDHRVRNCDKFDGFEINERWKAVEQNGMCQRCLTCHGKWPCRTAQPCGVNGCKEMHHKLLHPGKPNSPASQPGTSGVVTTHRHQQNAALFKVLPVTLSCKGKSVTAFAFLDDGSNVTLLESGIADELGLEGVESPLCLQWTNNVTRNETCSKRVNLSISGVGKGSSYPISDVRTVDSLGLPQQSLNYEKLVQTYPYLRGLPVQSYADAAPKILIGVDNAWLKLALSKRDGRNGEPIAIKTRLGWTIFGGKHDTQRLGRTMVHVCDCSTDKTLNDLVKNYFEVESLGITGLQPPESFEDQRARDILQTTTKRTESGRFETGLLWKLNEINFPNSYPMAERRLKCLERRLQADPELKKNVSDQIVEYQELGYAHKITEEELRETDQRRVWYLPLGVVRNPRKPNKVRVIWDAAARVGGVSLNSLLLKGPDLLTPLLSVLCRFRQRQYAIAGDIRQMFHQLLIIKPDRQSQRFLWRTDPHSLPDIYVMDVATFGATCSPCSAQYTKNLNASEYADRYPKAASAIVDNTYVDDYLDSTNTIEEAVALADEVRTIHRKAGFEIRNWQSNSSEILKRVGGESSDAVKNFSVEKTTVAERVLGMMWVPNKDLFVFSAQFNTELLPLMAGDVVPTKRQVLRVVMSLFDPLGLVATYSIHGKILIQDIWRSGISWDDPITSRDFTNWQRWVKLAPELDRVRIPRCYFPNYDPECLETLQLHVFVDASELAYCCVAYFRIVDRGIPRCALIAAKAKVTPLKPQSIPRNELNAGVLGVRLMKTIGENHTFHITKRYLHTDSTVLLAWLKADPRNYRPYVQFRTTEINADSELEEWNWVPTRLNIADKATKWGNGPSFDPDSKWYRGPDFLYLPENEWPARKPVLNDPTEELRTSHVHQEVIPESLLDFSSFSGWNDLIKKMALLHHFLNRCRSNERVPTQQRTASLKQQDYVDAENSLWRMVQAREFAEEIAILRKNEGLPVGKRSRLKRSSPLAKLSPFLDEHGVLRMGSRIDPKAWYYDFDFRNPVIVPKNGHVTELLVQRIHQRYGHANRETIINELRQRYHIPKLRSVVRKAIERCMWCRVYRATPATPKMAPLPQPRVTPYVRPFTFTGVDYLGPLIVKRGRSNVKRWVALFTCLTVRAVHLEVVHSLSTESCKMAIRRFVAKRGAPQQIFSDNGTNFRGAARELANEIKAINHAIAGTFTNAETEWNFNPPAAPHMGGVWERQVRSVKEAFKVLSHKELLDDEGLVTFFAEVEMIVNSRPLTFVPVESSEHEAITPNNFLLMSSSGANNPARIPVDEAVALTTNWKLMQHLLNQFWKRWIKAYLPTIARRTKWFAEVRPLQEGDLVVIVDETVRNGWLRGRVTKAYPGIDGQVRKVDTATTCNQGGFTRRAGR